MTAPESPPAKKGGGSSFGFFRAWESWLEAGDETGEGSLDDFHLAAQAHKDPSREETQQRYELEVESDPSFGGEPVLLDPGDEFAGLRVESVLGSGGMATVYRAWDPEHEGPVALKLLHRGLVSDSRHLKRFRREARVASRLRHPHIVATLTYGELGGAAYLTMPVVEGPTLEEYVEEHGPLAPLEAAKVAEQVARAIDAAHAQRVVHRDLKPSNVMLHADDGPLVLDFGLAKHLHHDPNLTETGEVLGTPTYLAPEQVSASGDPVDHRIDVYGLGGILYYLLTGRPPHSGESAIKVLQAILHREPPRLRDVQPELPEPLEVVCAKALSRHPVDRYPTAGEFADDLARFRNEARVKARLPGPAQRLLRSARRHPLVTALSTTLVILLVSAGFALRGLADRVARHDRSERGLELLAVAVEHAQNERHEEADRDYLRAMLETKSAFLESPDDDVLRAALARVKRARMEYAESRGNWGLAEELRQNLARLESNGELAELLPAEDAPPERCAVEIEGLDEQRRVRFLSWDDRGYREVAQVGAAEPSVVLPPGSYLAIEHQADGSAGATFLVVMDPGHRHVLRLGHDAPPPPGVFKLPGPAPEPGAAPEDDHAN